MQNNPFDILEKRLIHLESLILDIKHCREKTSNSLEERLYMDIDQFINYHPNHPAKSTVYRWVNQRIIPHHKKGRSLYFVKTEIDDWLKTGRRKTKVEIQEEAQYHLKAKGGRHE